MSTSPTYPGKDYYIGDEKLNDNNKRCYHDDDKGDYQQFFDETFSLFDSLISAINFLSCSA
jgi:hypothetical protein